jgi:hypothetical protein
VVFKGRPGLKTEKGTPPGDLRRYAFTFDRLPVELGGETPAQVSGRFDSHLSQIQITGEADATETRDLAALTPLGDQIDPLLPKDGSTQLNLSCQHNNTAPPFTCATNVAQPARVARRR